MEDRIISPEMGIGEEENFSLRPKNFSEYIGQEKVKENLDIFVKAARKRGEALDHVLLYGPPGLGKTTLAGIIANEMESSLNVTSGPAIERPGDLAAILTNLEEADILFIDEIHRLNRSVEEVLYPAMEDRCLDIMIGKGPGARSVRIDLPAFTLVGATTRAGLLSSPLRDRFGVIERLEFYNDGELMKIITRSAGVLGIDITDSGAAEIAGRSRGTPRVANRILKRVRDYAEICGKGSIDGETAAEALERFGVDAMGLDGNDIRMLEAIITKYDGGPVGIESIAASINEDAVTLEDVCEPFLMQKGFLKRTSRGRVCTDAAYRHLGLKGGKGAQGKLFDGECD